MGFKKETTLSMLPSAVWKRRYQDRKRDKGLCSSGGATTLWLLTERSALLVWRVKGGDKVYHRGGGIVYHRHDEKELNWGPGGVRSGAGVRSSGVLD